MPETNPTRPFKIETTNAHDQPGIIALFPETFLLAYGDQEPVALDPYEYQLLHMLASSPNEPFKLADVRELLPDFTKKYAPTPGQVVKGLIESVPELESHVLSIIKGTTQFFSFLDTAGFTDLFRENIENMLNEPMRNSPEEQERRKRKILKIVSVALAAVATSASAAAGVHYHNTHK